MEGFFLLHKRTALSHYFTEMYTCIYICLIFFLVGDSDICGVLIISFRKLSYYRQKTCKYLTLSSVTQMGNN